MVTELRHLIRRRPEPRLVQALAPLAVRDTSEPGPDLAVTRHVDLVHEPGTCAAVRVHESWVLDVPRREVVVHTEPGDAGYATVRRLPRTAPPEVLGVDVDLAAPLADLWGRHRAGPMTSPRRSRPTRSAP